MLGPNPIPKLEDDKETGTLKPVITTFFVSTGELDSGLFWH